MATDFFANLQNEDEKDKVNNGQVAQATGGESPIVNGQDQQQRQEGGTRSGAFTNLQQYLDVNDPKNLSDKVVGRAGSYVDSARSAQDTAAQSFKSDADKGGVERYYDAIEKAKSAPVEAYRDPNLNQRYKANRDAYYKGPNTLADRPDLFTEAYSKTDKAKQLSKSLLGEGGKQAALDELFGSGVGRYDYTQGQKNLDSLLLSGQDSRKDLEGLYNKALDTENRFGSLKGELEGYATNKRAETDETRKLARGAIGLDDSGNFTEFAPINNVITDAKQTASNANNVNSREVRRLIGNANSRQMSDQDLNALGLRSGQSLFGLDFSKLIPDAPRVGYQEASTNSQRLLAEALADLAGRENTYLPGVNPDRNDQFASLINTGKQQRNQHIQDILNARQAYYNDLINTKDRRLISPVIREGGGGSIWDELSPTNQPGANWSPSLTPGHSQSSSGSFDPNFNESILEALDRGQKGADLYKNWGLTSGGGEAGYQNYLQAIADLKSLQESLGYTDTINGLDPSGSWKSYNTYGGALPTSTKSGVTTSQTPTGQSRVGYDWSGKPITIGNVRY